ncbi:unnamed protein product [Clonostachys solani]|uniref:HD domain-containing protein n=1 Tax=Clonostachys solani TaxID=160281 RepID=A0A9N9ZJQ3_9HYPO|nr:unnamed protein product [Clonostachys solani]
MAETGKSLRNASEEGSSSFFHTPLCLQQETTTCHSNAQHHDQITPNHLDRALLRLVPDHPVAKAALDIALRTLSPAILNHSLPTYIYAKSYSSLLQREPAPTGVSIEPVFLEPHTLFVACLFHDLATGPEYDADATRFEVVGAQEAAKLLRKFGVGEASIREAWLAMSLHSTPGVAEHLSGTTGAFRRAIRAEFGGFCGPELKEANPELQESDLEIIQERLPRLDIEKVLGDAVVRQALQNRAKAPVASWPGQLLVSHDANPGWEGVNRAF